MTHPDEEMAAGLASRLGISVEELGELVPGPIEEVTVNDAPTALWFVAGDPYLVLIGLGAGVTYIGEPVITWRGTHTPLLGVAELSELSRMAPSWRLWFSGVRRGP